MSFPVSRLAGALFAALLIFGLAACPPQPVPPVAPLPPPVTAPPPQTLPVTPIRLPKPPVLGPINAAIVELPTRMDEPMIRVGLGGERSTPVSVNPRHYRGTVKTYQLPNGNYFTINRLPLESYLAGIQEILASWNPQTFRAQAIASRTYALYQILTQGQSKNWDVSADVSSQVYGGIASETAKSRAAVAATRGQVLIATAAGRSGIFCAFFSACAGNASQDPAEAWGDMPVPTLTARRLIPEYEARCAKFSWPQIAISKPALTHAIQTWGQRNSLAHLAGLGPIQSVIISQRNPATGRPTEIRLTDTAGRWALMRAEEFRIALLQDPARDYTAPFSSNCDILDAGTAIILANGHGYGHGIGLSQWGAQGMALAGKSHQEILGYYYPGAGLKTAW